MHTRTLHAEFPTTGQPVRVILIDDEPWFPVADVCRILGGTDPRQAAATVAKDGRSVDIRALPVTPGHGKRVSSAQGDPHCGNPNLDLVNESGLDRLVLRSDLPSANHFRDWVTRELLPSVRRAHTDLGATRELTRDTLAAALNSGAVVPPVPEPEPVSAFDLLGQTFQLYPDGSVHCPHGAMDPVFPTPDEDDGPPYGPRFRCVRLERVGILGSRAHRPCPPVRLTDLARACHRPPYREPAPVPSPCSVPPTTGAPADVLTVVNGVR